MAVSVSIPITQDYRSVILAAGEADNINSIALSPTHLFGVTNSNPAKLIRLNRDDFSQRTVITFPNDGEHDIGADVLYSSSQSKVYVLFRNSGSNTLMISVVNPATMAEQEFWREELFPAQFGSFTTDETWIYVITGPFPNAYIAKVRLDAAIVNSVTAVPGGLTFGRNIRYSQGKLYVAGQVDPPDSGVMWFLKMDADTLALDAQTTFSGSGPTIGSMPNNMGVSTGHIWVGSRNSGAINQVAKSDLAVVQVPTNIVSQCRAMEDDGKYVWALFDNGRAVRINTENGVQNIYALNASYHFRMVAGDPYLFASFYSAPSKLERYHIPPIVVDTQNPGPATFIAPVANATVNGIITLEATATDTITEGIPPITRTIPLYKMEFSTYINNVLTVIATAFRDSEGRYRASFDTNRLFNGQASFFARGIDEAGNVGAYAVRAVIIANTPVIIQSWAKQFHGSAGAKVNGYATAIDGSGNVITGGRFVGTVDFAGISKSSTASGGWDAFIAKFNSSGTIQWVNTFGAVEGDDVVFGLACDNANNIIAIGAFKGTVNFGNGQSETTPSGGQGATQQAFLAKYNSSGVCQWANQYGGGFDNNTGRAVACLGTDIYPLIEHYLGTNFGGGALPVFGSLDIAVARLDSNGNQIWAKGFGSTSADYPKGISVDSAGNVCITGENNGPIDFGGGDRRVSSGSDMFCAKLAAADGSHLWSFCKGSTTAPTNGSTQSGGVAFDLAGDVIVTGTFTKTVNFGGTDKTAVDGGAAFYKAKYASGNGSHIWSDSHGATVTQPNNTNRGLAIATGTSSSIALAGKQRGSLDFGDGQISYPIGSGGNGFLASYQSDHSYRVHKIHGAGDSSTNAVAMQNNDILVIGNFAGTLTLENGISFVGPSVTGFDNYDVFVIKYTPPPP